MDTNKTPPEGLAGMKKPRLTAMERLAIETGLDAGKTPYAIAQEIGRPPKTVMREIRGRAVESDKGAVGRVNNRCAHRYECTMRDVCKACCQRRSMQCKFCRQCNSHCPDYIEDRCARLESSPFVCNGCKDRNRCTLRKRFYRNDLATENYREILVESRRGVNVTEAELLRFDELLYRLTKNGQSVHAAVVNNPGLFTVSEKTLYRYIDGGLLSTKNGDLPRKCSLRPRRGKGVDNLWVPSKHFGVSHDLGGSLRMQPEMRKTGYAAACAAKIALARGLKAKDVPYADLKPLLDKAGCLRRRPGCERTNVYHGRPFEPFSDDQVVAALRIDVTRTAEWWQGAAGKASGTPAECAAYAYWTAWKCRVGGTAEARQALADKLAAAMARGAETGPSVCSTADARTARVPVGVPVGAARRGRRALPWVCGVGRGRGRRPRRPALGAVVGVMPLKKERGRKCHTRCQGKRMKGLTKCSRTRSFCSFVFCCLRKPPRMVTDGIGFRAD